MVKSVSLDVLPTEKIQRDLVRVHVALYIRDSIQYKRLTDLPEDFMKLISIQLSKPKVKPSIVAFHKLLEISEKVSRNFSKGCSKVA